ncbi:MAG: glycosyltransferase, partial [Anaerolineae bacterium]
MKVAFVSLFRRGHGGGEGRVAHELARHFAERHDVVMICPSNETGLYEADDSRLRIFGVRSAGGGEFQMPALSAKTVRAMFDFLDAFSPDAVHAHEPALMGLIGQIWAKMHRVPFVHTSHVLPSKVLDFGATDALDMKLLRGSFSESISRRLLTDFYSNCDALIALNQRALTSLRDFGYKGKIFIIPNGRDLERYVGCANADVTAEEKVLTFVGYLSERKNQAYLIKAHRELPRAYKLVLLGKALKPSYEDHLKEYCRAHGLQNVEFPGQVPHKEIPAYLERAHVLVSASKMEVQSLVVIEALASGTPVVGLSNETIDELVDDEVGHKLPSKTPPETFAAAVQRICILPQPEYDELCENARARVSHLDWSHVIDQTVSAYRELMEEKASITKQGGAMLADLVATLPSGEVRDILLERIEVARREPGPLAGFLMSLSLGERW